MQKSTPRPNSITRWISALLLFILLSPPACLTQTRPEPTTASQELTVAAAASLQFAFPEIAAQFEQQTGARVTLVFGSTGQLTQQIENGAPYDLLAAADLAHIRQLADENLLLTDTIAVYARGQIVLAVNRTSGAAAADLYDLLSPEIRHVAIANPAYAPYGAAARQALQAAGVWDEIQAKLVLGETVRQTLQYVQNGDAEVGVIPLSEANVPEITWTLIDPGLYDPIDHALAVIHGAEHEALARRFAAFVAAPTARAILQNYGFTFPAPEADTRQP